MDAYMMNSESRFFTAVKVGPNDLLCFSQILAAMQTIFHPLPPIQKASSYPTVRGQCRYGCRSIEYDLA